MVMTVYLDAATAPNATGPTDGGTFVELTAGNGGSVSGAGGGVSITAGASVGGGFGGSVAINAGYGAANAGGSVLVTAADGDVSGGHVVISPGLYGGLTEGPNGLLILQRLPTVDPLVANAVWNDAGVLKLSAGP